MTAGDSLQHLVEAFVKFKKTRYFMPHAFGLPQGEFFMLHHVDIIAKKNAAHGTPDGVKVSELSAVVQMSMPAVSQMLNSLQGKGYVRRVAAESDRRVVYVVLTEKGRELLEKTMKDFLQRLEEVVAIFGEDNTNQLAALSDKFCEAIEEVRKRHAAGARHE